MKLSNSYIGLPEDFYQVINPLPVKAPRIIAFNEELAECLGLEIDPKDAVNFFSGNSIPDNTTPIALNYAGHQFGNFVHELGDGRATLLGEIEVDKERFDIQLKGSGPTKFSRQGDGRSALGPVIREYILSEAMHHLNIPTTRALAAVLTGEHVFREEIEPGGILTRIAKSHIRVGTFQYIAARKNEDELKMLLEHVIKRHYPNIDKAKNKSIEILKIVLEKQVDLVVHWMRVGFIHGVMNTDNMSISGETIDYGPCAFMDVYDPKTVFSSIDRTGRYAYCNQPVITKWNLARFAECLIPLIDKDQNNAIKIATEIINSFEKKYEEKWLNMMRDKLGLFGDEKNDQSLILDLLTWMHEVKADYTNTFCYLMGEKIELKKYYEDKRFLNWTERWKNRLKLHNNSPEKYLQLMRSVNPLVIPRNHKVEEVLESANQNNFQPLTKLIEILSKPYLQNQKIIEYQLPSNQKEKYQTFCGT